MTIPSARKNKARLKLPQLVHLLAAMREKPCSYEDLQASVGIGRTAVRLIVAAFRSVGLAHIAEWEERHRVAFTPMFVFGPGNDAAPPEVRSNGRPSRGYFEPSAPKPRTNIVALAVLLRAIQVDPKSLEELHEETGMAHTTLSPILRELHAHKMVHIAEYGDRSPNGGSAAKKYLAGLGRDASPPKVLGRDEINRRYREGRKTRDRDLQILHALAGRLQPAVAAEAPEFEAA